VEAEDCDNDGIGDGLTGGGLNRYSFPHMIREFPEGYEFETHFASRDPYVSLLKADGQGMFYTGWVRPDKTQPARYVDAAGATIPLRAGRTWVELLPAGSPVEVTDAPPPPTTVAPVTAPPTTAKKKK
jgi:hypothetical protein